MAVQQTPSHTEKAVIQCVFEMLTPAACFEEEHHLQRRAALQPRGRGSFSSEDDPSLNEQDFEEPDSDDEETDDWKTLRWGALATLALTLCMLELLTQSMGDHIVDLMQQMDFPPSVSMGEKRRAKEDEKKKKSKKKGKKA